MPRPTPPEGQAPSESKVRIVARKVLPPSFRSALRWMMRQPRERKRAMTLGRTKRRMNTAAGRDTTVRVLDYDVRINQGPAAYDLYEDIFLNNVYEFNAERTDPRILDCGSNIGMSVLYFKHRYPRARVVAFEPDPAIATYLHDNIEGNHLTDVQIVNGALCASEGTLILKSDGGVGSHLEGYGHDVATAWTTFEVPCARLRDYLSEPVDFMKMNIEGAEYEVLADSEAFLGQIREMNIEYHRLPGVPCTLHPILELLHRTGFEYVVSDFGMAMYGRARPPVRVDAGARYWRQIYARRTA